MPENENNQSNFDETGNGEGYEGVELSLDNCIMPEDMLANTPSKRDGIPQEMEDHLRFFGCELLQTSGILLKLPQVAMATAQILYQRFFYCKSFLKHDYEVLNV
ncbi:Cyclin-L1 [Thelohanellus kitauei]|uniref:Cyclin-L1 n=1 Tax=Thelohanellus kitauei TaxID=669202 RepID=A0A0C2N282_THEKT|nr:Cyclin-L1 [Thelohanellus kitauei]